jgi:RNA polymerase sigma factor (sigma-70 family)
MVSKRTVYVIDDDEDVRNSLRWLLRSAGYVVREYGTAEDFLPNAIDAGTPACVLLDVNLPGKDGLTLLREIRQQVPQLAVLMVTGFGDVPMAVKALKLGALDFIEKPYTDELLLEKIAAAWQREPELLERERRRAEVEKRLAKLTPREREVFGHLAQGLRSRAIAEKLGIGERTLESHRQRVMQKIEVNSIAELVRLSMFLSQ